MSKNLPREPITPRGHTKIPPKPPTKELDVPVQKVTSVAPINKTRNVPQKRRIPVAAPKQKELVEQTKEPETTLVQKRETKRVPPTPDLGDAIPEPQVEKERNPKIKNSEEQKSSPNTEVIKTKGAIRRKIVKPNPLQESSLNVKIETTTKPQPSIGLKLRKDSVPSAEVQKLVRVKAEPGLVPQTQEIQKVAIKKIVRPGTRPRSSSTTVQVKKEPIDSHGTTISQLSLNPVTESKQVQNVGKSLTLGQKKATVVAERIALVEEKNESRKQEHIPKVVEPKTINTITAVEKKDVTTGSLRVAKNITPQKVLNSQAKLRNNPAPEKSSHRKTIADSDQKQLSDIKTEIVPATENISEITPDHQIGASLPLEKPAKTLVGGKRGTSSVNLRRPPQAKRVKLSTLPKENTENPSQSSVTENPVVEPTRKSGEKLVVRRGTQKSSQTKPQHEDTSSMMDIEEGNTNLEIRPESNNHTMHTTLTDDQESTLEVQKKEMDDPMQITECKEENGVSPLAKPQQVSVPKKRGRPRLYPESKKGAQKKTTPAYTKRAVRTPKDSPKIANQNLNDVEAFIGSERVVNIQKGLLAGPSLEHKETAALAIQFLRNMVGADQAGSIAKKVMRVMGAIRRKSLDKKPEKMASEVDGNQDCIAYVGEVPEQLKAKGVNPVSIEEVKSWYGEHAKESELTVNVQIHEGTYRIAVRPEGLSALLSKRTDQTSGEINIKVPLPCGSSVSPMNEFIAGLNQINGLPPPQAPTFNSHDRNHASYNPNCPGPQHKNWLQDNAQLEEEFRNYVSDKMTYYESVYHDSLDENCETHVSPQITRKHVTAMLVTPVERFFKLCANGERCETYKLGLLNRVEPFVGMSYLSPLELSYAIEQRFSPTEGGLCYLCILSYYTTQYAHNSAAGSSIRIKVPFQHIHGIPGEYIKESIITQTTGMTHGLITPFRQFCTTDYVPTVIDVKLADGTIMKNVRAFEEKGHLVFRYSSRNSQPLCTDPQHSYTIGCEPSITTCYLLRENIRSGVPSKRQLVDIIELYYEMGFIQRTYKHLILGPASSNPNGSLPLIDVMFVEPPRPTRRRSVTIRTKAGDERRNTHLSSSSVSHVLSNTIRSSSNHGGSASKRASKDPNQSSKIPQQQKRFGDITYDTFGGKPFDMVFSETVSSMTEHVDHLATLFGYKQSGVDGTEIICYPFISLYDHKKIEIQRVEAHKRSLKRKLESSLRKNSGSNTKSIGDHDDDDDDDDDCEDEGLEEGEEMFALSSYKFYHAIMIRINVAWSIGETISRAGKLTFSQVIEVLDNISDPHRDTQTNKDSKEAKELKERVKLYDRLTRKYVIQKLVCFINGHREVLNFFSKYGAIPDDELEVVQDKWVNLSSKVKEWRTVRELIEPKIPHKPNKNDENHYTPTIRRHSKPSPREIISEYISNNPDCQGQEHLPYFGEFESTRLKLCNLGNDELSEMFTQFSDFPHWNPQHLFDNLKENHWDDLDKCAIYLSLLLRIHISYEMMERLETESDVIITRLLAFVNSPLQTPFEEYESYELSDQHLTLMDLYERLPTYENFSGKHTNDDEDGVNNNVDHSESDFFRVFYMDLDKYHPTTEINLDEKLQPISCPDKKGKQYHTTEYQLHEEQSDQFGESSQKEPSSRSEDQLEPWVAFARSLLSKSPQGRHHVYYLRKKLMELREIVYQLRAFVSTHVNLASYLHTSGIIEDEEIITDRTNCDGGFVSKYLFNYPGDNRFYGEGSQPDCVSSHMYVNFFSHKGTENRVWYYLIGKLLPRCCQSRKWASKHEQACQTDVAYRSWVCMCLIVSLTAMYRYRRQWLSFPVLLKVWNTCRHLRTDKDMFISFQNKHPGLVMASLRESMIWQIEKNPALLRVYLEYFQQWRSFGLTVKHKTESNCHILNREGEIRDLSVMVDQLFSGARFVFRRVCFDFFSFILAIFKETNATLSDGRGPRSGGSSKRKSYTRKQRTPPGLPPKKRNLSRAGKGKAINTSGKSDDDDDDEDGNDQNAFNYRASLYDFTKNSVGITGTTPPRLSDETTKLVDMFVEFMNPHDDIDLRSLSMIGMSSEGVDNLRFIYGLFLAGEQNRSSATMLKQMTPHDYELAFYFFTRFRMHSSLIAIPCDADMRARQIEGVRWKYAIRKGEQLPDASTAITFSSCCSTMKSLPGATEGPRHYGHARIVYSEEDGMPVCWAKREKNQRRRLPTSNNAALQKNTELAQQSILGKRSSGQTTNNENTGDITTISATPTEVPPGKYQKSDKTQTHPTSGYNTRSSVNSRKDRYEKLCGETPVTAIPGTFIIQHDPLKEKPCPTSYTLCPGSRCGSVTKFSLSMWGPNGFTCTICDKTDRESMKIPRCDVCQAVKKRSQSLQVFMYDDSTRQLQQFLVCPFCSRKCSMDDQSEPDKKRSPVHTMTFFECQALVERVVTVDDRSQQFAWEHWKARRMPKVQKITNSKRVFRRKKRLPNAPTPSQRKRVSISTQTEGFTPDELGHTSQQEVEENAPIDDVEMEEFYESDVESRGVPDPEDNSDISDVETNNRKKVVRLGARSVKPKKTTLPPTGKTYFSTRVGRMPRKRRN